MKLLYYDDVTVSAGLSCYLLKLQAAIIDNYFCSEQVKDSTFSVL